MLGKLLREAACMMLFAVFAFGLVSLTLAAPIKLMLYGDSLMAGLGLPAEDGFAAQLRAALKSDGIEVSIINASVSGDTSGAALQRLDWSLAEKPDAVLLGLGGNDMLRGLPPAAMADNLDAIVQRLTSENVPVLLLGMRASPSLGADYVENFERVFSELASKYDIALYPFFLEGVATNPSLNQPDGIHPNAKGVTVIVKGLLPSVKQLLSP